MHKKIAIWGTGKEGVCTKTILEKKLKDTDITFVTEENIQDIYKADILIKSPGVSLYRPEIKKAKVRIVVGGETIYSETKELTTTNISAKYTGTGVKEVKVYVDDVVKSSGKAVDLSKGDTTITIE